MEQWWYAIKGKKSGPVEIDQLRQLLQEGKISLSTIVWQEGMAAWQSLGEVESLRELKDVIPPPLPLKTTPDPSTYPLAGRWPRFLARIFDVWWEVLFIGFVFGVIHGLFFKGFFRWINEPSSSWLFGLACLPVALVFDAALYRIFGNTPGKAMLALKVTTLDYKPLMFKEYLVRNFSLWITGLAFGIPIINLFTLASQSRRLKKGQQAIYDENKDFRVRSRPTGFLQKALFGIAFACLFIGMVELNSMGKTTQNEVNLNSVPKNYSWENPWTKYSTTIDAKWKYSAQTNETGEKVYTFSEQGNHAFVIISVEQAANFTLDDYVTAFQKSNASNMRFIDGGLFSEKEGRQNWQGMGSMVKNTTYRLNVKVSQVGSEFWRVVTIQTMPYDYSDPLVEQIQIALWNTVR